MIKWAIVGSRAYPLAGAVRDYVDTLEYDDWVVSGHATGVDSIAEKHAFARQLTVLSFPAQWDRYPGKSAGYRRNLQIVANADFVVAFWDEESNGTVHTMKEAHKVHKLWRVYGMLGDIIYQQVPDLSADVAAFARVLARQIPTL